MGAMGQPESNSFCLLIRDNGALLHPPPTLSHRARPTHQFVMFCFVEIGPYSVALPGLVLYAIQAGLKLEAIFLPLPQVRGLQVCTIAPGC